jgi:hypothetical protein
VRRRGLGAGRRVSPVSLVVLQLFPKLMCERMQVGVLVFASVSALTAGEVQGVAPADVLSAFFRSRRLGVRLFGHDRLDRARQEVNLYCVNIPTATVEVLAHNVSIRIDCALPPTDRDAYTGRRPQRRGDRQISTVPSSTKRGGLGLFC